MKQKLKRFFGRKSLRTKFAMIIVFITVSISVLNLAVSSAIFDAYEEKYYGKVLDTTKMFSMAIEDTLDDNDFLIKGITENAYFNQMYDDDYKQVSLEALRKTCEVSDTIIGVWFVDDDDKAMIVSNERSLDVRAIMNACESGRNNSERMTDKWFSVEIYDGMLFKTIEATETIGADIVYAVDMNVVCGEYDNVVNVKDSSEFLIYHKHQLLYGQAEIMPEYSNVTEYIENDDIVEVDSDGHQQILSRYYSTKSGLYYVCVSDYDKQFKNILLNKRIAYICLSIAILVLLSITYMFIAGILKPVRQLTRKMTGISTTSDLDDVDEYFYYSEYTDDEIGLLNRHFDNTIRKLKELTDENFEKQKLLQETRYKALQLQIRPHFLYNTLETVKCLGITGNKKELAAVIDDLGNLLRKSLKSADFVSLEDELELLHHYVNIQKVRYDERFEYSEDIRPGMLSRGVPKMILQPIVENSINYCVDSTDEKCIVKVRSEEHPDHISIVIEDNGPGMDKEFLERLKANKIQPRGLGIGLANIDARLKLVYGDEYGLDIMSVKGEGTTVVIKIPKGK